MQLANGKEVRKIMYDDFIKQLLNLLGQNLNLKENKDFIETLFNQRAENFHISITKNKEYEKCRKNIRNVNDKIFAKYQNADDIISSIEEYESASGEMGSLIERQMYKYGLYDGLHLILDGLQKN